jgi:molybdenum cofactor cytidylyltransferase
MLSLIVLAAGKSTRMHGRNKLLAKIDGKAMIRKVTEAALNSKVDEVIVVLGFEARKVQVALADLPCRFVVNREYELGQSSSVKAGLGEVGEATQAILVLPGDVAKIDPASIDSVVDEYLHHSAKIIIAAHKGKLGHPILLARELFDEIRQIDEQTMGLKALIKKHESDVRLVETGSENVLRDVDTPKDFRTL